MSLAETTALPLSRNADRLSFARRLSLALIVLLLIACYASLAIGASELPLWSVLRDMATGDEVARIHQIVLFDIRLPRLILGVLIGASLAVSGAMMQGLFRNPLADPGIVGVGAGAGLGAVIAIVVGSFLPLAFQNWAGSALVPVCAFIGAWVSTIALYGVSTRGGKTSVATMLLAGIALGSMIGAVIGILTYMADDAQLRDLTFWGMGSLAAATWSKVLTVGPAILICLALAPLLARGLNGLALGEAAAMHIGINVQRTKNLAILFVAVTTGLAVSVSGGIGFVGIVVPHLLRLASGPDHRALLVNAGLLGATLLVAADVISRTIVAPAELPIGIITAILGSPVFLWILLTRQKGMGL